ncbi:MAG: hypothetical protein AAF582_05045 [Pseudomonadota bacterium]
MAIEECGGLLDDDGLCTVCVAPHLQVDAGALKVAKVGGAVALPVSIANVSVVERPIFVTRVWSREASGKWQDVRLGWERLDAGQSRPVSIIANELHHAGAHSIEILVELSTRWRWREERYAFSAGLTLQVKAEDNSIGPTVTVGGDTAGHGNTVYISGKSEAPAELETTIEALDLEMLRAEVEERDRGIRGLEGGVCVPRNVPIAWRGFAPERTPLDGPILTTDSLLAVGRARARRAGGTGDVRLLVDSLDGSLDEDLSRLISRRHFELYVECDRLMVRVIGTGGLRVDGKAYGPGKAIALDDGARIEPLVKSPDVLSLEVQFQIEFNLVTQVIVSRLPANEQGN